MGKTLHRPLLGRNAGAGLYRLVHPESLHRDPDQENRDIIFQTVECKRTIPEEDDRNALEAVRLAVELGADVNAANDIGETAIHGAAYVGANDIVQFLVEKGAKVDAVNVYGQTAWTIAAEVMSP